MNIIAWNCRGARKAAFRSHVRELVRIHDPAILIVMETRVGGDRAKAITDDLPFDGAIHTDTMGYAGGLWLLWNGDRVEINQLAITEQEIHVAVKVLFSKLNWLLSAIYASPRCAERQVLWGNLKIMADLHDLPWVMAGDFNEPLSESDKFGGKGVSVNRTLQFKECLDACNMIDLGFLGPRFTWTNRRDIQALIQERIDRFFVNPQWCLMYPEARVAHLTRCHSDHCPVLLELQPRNQENRRKLFKFQTCWLSNSNFPSVVTQAWSHSSGLAQAIDRFTNEAIRWNKEHFGNIFFRKKTIMARLNGIQRAMAVNPLAFLLNLENELLKDLDAVLNQEEELWALKSRVNWMIQGYRNMAFYHVSTLVRRKRN